MSTDVDDDIRTGFFRQRRNLFVASLLLTFVHAAGLEIQPHQQIAGIGVTLDNPDAIFTALWIGWAYWFVRYIQYSNDIGDKDFFLAHSLRMDRFVPRIALRQIRRSGIPDRAEIKPRDYRFRLHGESRIKHVSPWRYNLDLPVFATPLGRGDVWSDIVRDYNVTQRWPLAVAHVRAWLYVIFRTRLFSEYILPYFVALIPVAYLLYRYIRAE